MLTAYRKSYCCDTVRTAGYRKIYLFKNACPNLFKPRALFGPIHIFVVSRETTRIMETLTLANVVNLSPTFTNFNENLVPDLFHKFIEIRVYGRQCTSDVVF